MSTLAVLILVGCGVTIPLQDEKPDLVTETPKALDINKRRAARASALKLHFAKGRIGDDRKGRVSVLSDRDLPARQRGALQKQVATENSDRDALLKELARVNNKLDAKEVGRRWIDARRKACPKGWKLQNDHGVWKKKKAKKGSLEKDFNKKKK